MIVANFHVISVPVAPYKTYPPLIVNANAMLSFPIAFESFQPVARKDRQIFQNLGSIQVLQFSPGHVSDIRWRSGLYAIKKLFSLFVLEALYHGRSVSRYTL